MAEGRKKPNEAFHELLVARAYLDVAEGRLTRDEADTHIELEWYNHLNPAPKPGTRVTHSFGAMLTRASAPQQPVGTTRRGALPAAGTGRDGRWRPCLRLQQRR